MQHKFYITLCFVICILVILCQTFIFSDTDEERTEAIFKKYEKEALEKGWKKKTLTVEKLERQLLWKASPASTPKMKTWLLPHPEPGGVSSRLKGHCWASSALLRNAAS